MTKEPQPRGAENQEKIIEAASRLMVEKGVKSTSLADIAREAQISKGTLYYYYSSKNDLIYDITERHLNHLTEELLAWIEESKEVVSPEQILLVVIEKITRAETRGKLHLYLLQDAVTSHPELKQQFRQKYREWRETIELGLQHIGGVRAVNHPILSHLLLALLDGLIIQTMLEVDDLPLAGVAKYLVDHSK